MRNEIKYRLGLKSATASRQTGVGCEMTDAGCQPPAIGPMGKLRLWAQHAIVWRVDSSNRRYRIAKQRAWAAAKAARTHPIVGHDLIDTSERHIEPGQPGPRDAVAAMNQARIENADLIEDRSAHQRSRWHRDHI